VKHSSLVLPYSQGLVYIMLSMHKHALHYLPNIFYDTGLREVFFSVFKDKQLSYKYVRKHEW